MTSANIPPEKATLEKTEKLILVVKQLSPAIEAVFESEAWRSFAKYGRLACK